MMGGRCCDNVDTGVKMLRVRRQSFEGPEANHNISAAASFGKLQLVLQRNGVNTLYNAGFQRSDTK